MPKLARGEFIPRLHINASIEVRTKMYDNLTDTNVKVK